MTSFKDFTFGVLGAFGALGAKERMILKFLVYYLFLVCLTVARFYFPLCRHNQPVSISSVLQRL